MFWDKAAAYYDFFEYVYNGSVNKRLVQSVSAQIDSDDRVLECACGTGMISKGIARKCRSLVATDFSTGMLKKSKRRLSKFGNVRVRRADITNIRCRDEYFDKVVAGNVIHLLDEPEAALDELMRVCKKGGMVIIPTYINNEKKGGPGSFIKMLEKRGAQWKRQFDYNSYREFFEDMGYRDARFKLVDGKMPCAIAFIRKQ